MERKLRISQEKKHLRKKTYKSLLDAYIDANVTKKLIEKGWGIDGLEGFLARMFVIEMPLDVARSERINKMKLLIDYVVELQYTLKPDRAIHQIMSI